MMDTHFTETMRLLRAEWRPAALALAVAVAIIAVSLAVMRVTDRFAESVGLSDAAWFVIAGLPFTLLLAIIVFYPPALMMLLMDRRQPLSFPAACLRALTRLPNLVLLAALALVSAFVISMIAFVPLAMVWSVARVPGDDIPSFLMRGTTAHLLIWYLVALPLVLRSMLLAPAFVVMDGSNAFQAWRRSVDACSWHAVWLTMPFLLPLIAVRLADSLPLHMRSQAPDIMVYLPPVLYFWLLPATLSLALLSTIPIWRTTRDNDRPALDTQDYHPAAHSP